MQSEMESGIQSPNSSEEAVVADPLNVIYLVKEEDIKPDISNINVSVGLSNIEHISNITDNENIGDDIPIKEEKMDEQEHSWPTESYCANNEMESSDSCSGDQKKDHLIDKYLHYPPNKLSTHIKISSIKLETSEELDKEESSSERKVDSDEGINAHEKPYSCDESPSVVQEVKQMESEYIQGYSDEDCCTSEILRATSASSAAPPLTPEPQQGVCPSVAVGLGHLPAPYPPLRSELEKNHKGEPRRPAHRCQMPDCTKKSIFYCLECNKCLCIKGHLMCFTQYHQQLKHLEVPEQKDGAPLVGQGDDSLSLTSDNNDSDHPDPTSRIPTPHRAKEQQAPEPAPSTSSGTESRPATRKRARLSQGSQ